MQRIVINFLVLMVLVLSSCEKEKIVPQHDEVEQCIEDTVESMDAERADYMSSLPSYRVDEFHREMRKLTKSDDRTSQVWGTASNNRVYKWTGSYWSEPNPAARLKFVEVGSYGTGVWGIGTDQRVYKWTGSYWHEPNPSAGLYGIAALSADIAVGIGNLGKLYITYNGGANWMSFTNITGVREISMGDYYNFLWATDMYGNFKYFNSSTTSWELKANPSSAPIRDHSAMFGGGVWTTHYNTITYLSGDTEIDWNSAEVHYSNDGINFWEPNPAAGLARISSNGGTVAWGLGKENKVYKTNNIGASWFQPNTAARLVHITAN